MKSIFAFLFIIEIYVNILKSFFSLLHEAYNLKDKFLHNMISAPIIHFYLRQTYKLKLLWSGSFTFLTSSIICDVEKIFAKNSGFLLDTENRVLILDKVEIRPIADSKLLVRYVIANTPYVDFKNKILVL